MARIRVPDYIGFPHNLGIEERASLMCYGKLVAHDPTAASYDAVAIARNKSYSTVKNQLDSARRKLGTNTTWGAYLLMMQREKVQDQKWISNTKPKPGQRSSRPVKTGKNAPRPASERVRAAS